MTTLTSNDISSTPASSIGKTDALSLRIVQPDMQDRLIALPPGKCTVGSSERCQVHLDSETVRPLHCLIVREQSEATVTRWAPGAILNGQDFATAPLHAGDCLQIGDVQISLVVENAGAAQSSTPAQAVPASPTPESAPTKANDAFARRSPLFEEPFARNANPSPFPASQTQEIKPDAEASPNQIPSADSDQLVDRLKAASASARARCRKLVVVLRTMRDEASTFDQKIDDLQSQLNAAYEEREQIFSQLSLLQSESVERENQSAQEIDRLISELTTAYEKASTAEAALAETGESVDALRSDLEQQLSDAREKARASEASLAEQIQQADVVRAELANLQAEKDQWDQTRSAGELQRTKLAQALADREQSIETLQTELERFRQAADQADECRMDQAAAMEKLQEELDSVRKEREQLHSDQTEARKYQAELEQTLADSEQNLEVFQLELEKFQLTSRQTEQELGEKGAAFDDMQAEIAQLSEQRDQLITKRTEYQLREQGWEHELASRDHQIGELTNEIEQLRASVAEASQGAADQVSQVERFEAQLDELATERDQLLVAQAEQVENIQQWEEAVAARDRRIRELEEEHDGICQVLQSVEKGAFEQVDACNKLQDQLTELRGERDQLASALPDQRKYIQQLEQTLAERDGQITILSEELSKTTELQSALETQLADGSTAYQALESEVRELNARCEQLTTSHESSEADKAAAEQSLADCQMQLDQLQEQIKTAEQQRHELELIVADGSQSKQTFEAELSDLKSRYDQLTSDHRAEQERRQQLDMQLAERDQNLELFQVDLKSVQAELDRTIEQVSNLQTERETLNLQLTGLREELASQESSDGVSEASIKQERDELADELKALQEQFAELQSQSPDSTDELGESQELLNQLNDEKSQLELRAQQQEQHADALSAELESVRNELTAEKGELEKLSEQYQQSQSELEKAQQALQWVEQRLLEKAESVAEFTETAEAVEEIEPAEVEEPASANREPTNYPYDTSAAEFGFESTQQSDDTHDLADAEATIEDTSGEVGNQEELIETASDPLDESADVSVETPVEQAAEFVDDESFATEESLDYGNSYAAESSEFAHLEGEDYAATDEEFASTDYDENFAEEDASESDILIDSEPTAVAYQVAEAPDTEPEDQVKEFKPASFIDQYQHLLEDDNEAELEPIRREPTEPAQVENRLGAEIEAANPAQDDDSDEALEAYMSNMLRRMRGESNEDAPPPQSSQAVKINQNPNPVEAVGSVLENVAPQREVVEQENTDPIDMESLKRSSHKPSLPTDLAAMRELANSSARKAIAKHHKKRHLDKALGMFFVCLIAICVGAYMLLTATAAQNYLGVNFIGGSVAVLVGVAGGIKLLGLLLMAIREGSGEQGFAAKKTKAVDTPADAQQQVG